MRGRASAHAGAIFPPGHGSSASSPGYAYASRHREAACLSNVARCFGLHRPNPQLPSARGVRGFIAVLPSILASNCRDSHAFRRALRCPTSQPSGWHGRSASNRSACMAKWIQTRRLARRGLGQRRIGAALVANPRSTDRGLARLTGGNRGDSRFGSARVASTPWIRNFAVRRAAEGSAPLIAPSQRMFVPTANVLEHLARFDVAHLLQLGSNRGRMLARPLPSKTRGRAVASSAGP